MKDRDEMPDDAGLDELVRTHGAYSPPCYLREIDSAYAGYLTKYELIDFLNELLEGERAGERAAIHLMTESDEKTLHSALCKAAIDQARFCAMLARHVRELGGIPSSATAAFYDGLMKSSGLLPGRLAFLNQRQADLVRGLCEVLPSVRDDSLYHDLKGVLRFHEASVRRCDRFLKTQCRSSRLQKGASATP